MNTPAHALVNLVVLTRGDGSLRGVGGAGAEIEREARGAIGPDGERRGPAGPTRAGTPETWTAAAVMAGGVVPDAPMFLFYGQEKLAAGASEAAIWGERYFEPGWQAFFDFFNSLPLLAVGLYVAWRLGRPAWMGFLASAGLHVLTDVPLHGEDAHRPLFPLSDWRFESPVSYWDPDRFGTVVAPLELAAVAVCCVLAFRRFRSAAVRWTVGLVAAAYVGQWVWAAVVWG